jgi:AraC-like DNA-binding protein
MDMHSVAFGDARVIRAKLSGWRMTRSMGDLVHIVLPLVGVLTYRSGARDVLARQDQRAAVGRPFETITFSAAAAETLALYAPVDALVERAERFADAPWDRRLALERMADAIDLTSPAAQALARTLKATALNTMRLGAVGMSGIVTEGYEDLLLDFATVALFPDVARILGSSPVDCGSDVVREARDFILAHAAEPIELSRLAARLGVSMRALQTGFQKNFGCSPRDFIVECRLERARKRLEADSPNTITEIALTCGFGDLGHFSTRYRDKYGETPSETVRRNR